ncbi:MAG: hypothetical protein QW559_03145 [Candidatus Woesearchaeota archaeon]
MADYFNNKIGLKNWFLLALGSAAAYLGTDKLSQLYFESKNKPNQFYSNANALRNIKNLEQKLEALESVYRSLQNQYSALDQKIDGLIANAQKKTAEQDQPSVSYNHPNNDQLAYAAKQTEKETGQQKAEKTIKQEVCFRRSSGEQDCRLRYVAVEATKQNNRNVSQNKKGFNFGKFLLNITPGVNVIYNCLTENRSTEGCIASTIGTGLVVIGIASASHGGGGAGASSSGGGISGGQVGGGAF